MREILFRGKRIDTGEWVEGFYCQRENKVFGGKQKRHMIVIPTVDSVSGARWIDIDVSTAGQFTGLTDKNGKKIFEGDVVKLNTGSFETYAKITYSNGTFWIEKIKHDLINLPALHFISEKIDYCVVGNIYDNPELLKG